MADITFLMADLRERSSTDRIINPWVLLPLFLLPVVLIVVYFSFMLATLVMAPGAEAEPVAVGFSVLNLAFVLAITAAYGWLTWAIVSRRDRHFRRMARLAEDIAVYLRDRSGEVAADLSAVLERLRSVQRTMRETGRERGAVVWTIICLLTQGIGNLILWYLLMSDYKRHEQEEAALLAIANDGFMPLGDARTLVSRPVMPQRNFGTYLLLMFVTLGLFAMYWWWCMVADPNHHFRAHGSWEPGLEAMVTSPSGPPAPG